MNANINWGHLLFSFRGRINRAKWWLGAVLVPFLLSFVIFVATLFPSDIVLLLVTVVIYILVIWIYLATGAKRLHDLDRTGAWLVVFAVVPIVLVVAIIAYALMSLGLDVLTDQAPMDEVEVWKRMGLAFGIVMLLGLAYWIWVLVWFGCLRGTVGPNRFGPDPLERSEIRG